MSNDIEQYRPGFEAWARDNGYENLGGEYAGPGKQGWWYWSDETAHAWEGWYAAKREASTESADSRAIKALTWIANGHQNEQAKVARDTLANIGAVALTDEAKDAVVEAARKLVQCKGRYHTEQNFKVLMDAVAAHTKAQEK